MTEQPHDHRQHRSVSVRSLVGSILLILAIVVWVVLIYAIFEFSAAVGTFLQIVMDLGNSAAGRP